MNSHFNREKKDIKEVKVWINLKNIWKYVVKFTDCCKQQIPMFCGICNLGEKINLKSQKRCYLIN